jgi:hypothetical protein
MPWDPSEVVAAALQRHAEISDVQTAACVLLALGERRQGLVDEALQEQWLMGYLELLGRHRLWNAAAQVGFNIQLILKF